MIQKKIFIFKKFFLKAFQSDVNLEKNNLKGVNRSQHLFVGGAILKKPLHVFTSIFSRGLVLTPGVYQPIHPVLEFCLRLFSFMVGVIGVLLCLPLYLLGGIFQWFCTSRDDLLVEHTKGKVKKKLSASQPSSSCRNLTLFTRNLAMLPDAISNYNHLRSPNIRLLELNRSFKKIIKKHDPDIFLFQEVFLNKQAQRIKKTLITTHPHILCNIGEQNFGMNSGLFVASKHPLVHMRYIAPLYPIIMFAPNSIRPYFNVESLAHKGILFVVIKRDNQYELIVNAHLKSNSSRDVKERKVIERIRANQLRLIAQGAFNYLDELKQKFKIKIKNVYFGGDLNVSDVQDEGFKTFELSQRKSGLDDISFFFDSFFPSEKKDTWALDFFKKPNSNQTGFGQKNYNNDLTPVKGVKFDHVGFYRDKIMSKSKLNVPPRIKVKTIGDMGQSKGQKGPSSDHFGLLLKVKGK